MMNLPALAQPDEVFMVRILAPDAALGAAGVARYRPTFVAVA